MDSPEAARAPVEGSQENIVNQTVSGNKVAGTKELKGLEEKAKPGALNGTIDQKQETTRESTGDTSKTVRFSVTEIDVSVTEYECTGGVGEESVMVNPNNPRITISEPVGSPCDTESSRKNEPVPRGHCPLYYGIKSYIHDFYQSPDKEILNSGEYIQEDDFKWAVEPGKRRWKGCWVRIGLWVGINLMLLGIIAMLVGHLTTPRQTIVRQQGDFTVLDRWAATFNIRLEVCELTGFIGFTCGAVIFMLALLVSSYQQEQTRGYNVMAATVVPQTLLGNFFTGPSLGWGSHRIPVSGSVSEVQPTFVRTH